jgi:hypothetical protein
MASTKLNRREFIAASCSLTALPWISSGRKQVSLVVDPSDEVSGAAPVAWAVRELEQSLNGSNFDVHRCQSISQASKKGLCIVVAGSKLPAATALLQRSHIDFANKPESLALVPTTYEGRNVLLASGSDSRGLVYAVLEIADRVHSGSELTVSFPIFEQPTNTIRSVLRLFASEVEDKPWFNDREFWRDYLTMLATQRFNRFNLSLGLGYDFLRRVTDAYLLFPYPFLFSVPGYNVRVPQLSDTERDRNLEMLRFISEQTVARGLQFQLGLWMHGYEWIDSPNANYTISGLTAANHAPYCRDALRLLLQKCPAIGGVTIRTHGESGVEEGSYQFWQTIFEGVASCGRRVEIDLHTKGLDQTMLDNALATRQPITVSPKYWAEHLGLPYHQTDIRQLEVPDPAKQTSRLMNLSEGSRSFMRYGYGDLLREDRSWQVVHRVWPGTQRLLLWGDPVAAAAYSKAFTFCGSNGAEIMEPLTFKGRRGSGIAGDRCAYADATLRTHWDWQKFEYSYRLWGRLLYNADSDPAPWQRYLSKNFGEKGFELEAALANASRILPLITTAHLPSAANNNYWPEMYVNQSLVDAVNRGSYSDTPVPRIFGNVSPLDPQLFYRVNDFADDLLRNEFNGKYSPLEVAQWLDDYAHDATKHLRSGKSPEYRRLSTDVMIQVGLGSFFAAKLRAAVLYRVFEKTNEPGALEASLSQYRLARDRWSELANAAKDIYQSDITIGELPQLRGHWLDRLPGIDRDINALAQKLAAIKSQSSNTSVADLIKKILAHSVRSPLSCHHLSPKYFVPGEPLEVVLRLEKPATAATLNYRHVNQAERFQAINMTQRVPGSNAYWATISADYTNSPYPLQYYFEIKTPTDAHIHPGFSKDLMNQPYFLVLGVRRPAGTPSQPN